VRASDFLLEDDEPSDQYANIVTVLDLVQEKVRSGELSDKLPTQFIIRLIQNTGISNFKFDDLIAANEANESMKNIVKNITQDKISFVKDIGQSVTNAQDVTAAAANPEQTVSDMAKSAMKRRQS
jgi:hypothetical protein